MTKEQSPGIEYEDLDALLELHVAQEEYREEKAEREQRRARNRAQ